MATRFTSQYFKDKFTAVDEKNWATGRLHNEANDTRCALGQCSADVADNDLRSERGALNYLFRRYLDMYVATINDNPTEEFPQTTPKQRILAALDKIQEREKDGSILKSAFLGQIQKT